MKLQAVKRQKVFKRGVAQLKGGRREEGGKMRSQNGTRQTIKLVHVSEHVSTGQWGLMKQKSYEGTG